MTFLLDVNVLIALIDPQHASHQSAHAWFASEGHGSFATCPITQNGVIRIVGQPRYPNTPGLPAKVATILAGLCALPGHVFWPDNISMLDNQRIDVSALLTSAQVTDTYLLALAVAHGGRLATFDRTLSARAVTGGRAALRVIIQRTVNVK